MKTRASLGWTMAVLALATMASACATKGGVVPYDVAGFGAPDAPAAIPVSDAYRIGPADVLQINVFGVPEYSGDFVVDSVGRVQLPLIGNVALTGRSPDEAAQDITLALQRTYLRNPKVQVQIKTAAGQRITVDGAVGAPGLYAIAGKSTLMQAVALAKGTIDSANPRRTVIFRTINGQRMAAAFDLTDIRRGVGKDPEIYPNDIVVVDGNKNAKLLQTALQTIPVVGLFTNVAF